MRICYHCAHCGAAITEFAVDIVDEEKLGFDCLTREEREDIINVDAQTDTMHVKSLCDRCAAGWEAERAAVAAVQPYTVH